MKSIKLIAIALAAALALAACEEQGPFEEAGEKIDDATEDVGNAVEDACEDVKDAANAEDKDC
jgi:PBP1b-binding outer membrane lipoprotein LpoB